MKFAALGLPLLLLAAFPAAAQSSAPQLSVEAASDVRERGLSWTEGRAAAQFGAGVPVAGGFRADAWLTSLRGSDRHGGADAGLDVAGSYRVERGLLRLDAGATGRFFLGERRTAGALDYADLYAAVGGQLGPAELTLSFNYAPDQKAIGGDNLYVQLRGRSGVPGQPITLVGHVGRSSGSADDPVKAARLRPAGSYTDWAVGAEFARAPLLFAVTYSDTNVRRRPFMSPFADRGNVGARLACRLTFLL